MSEVVRTALVGAGGIAQAHALALARVDEVRAVAVADLAAAPAAALAEQLGVPSTTDIATLADPASVDLVILATPPDTHLELACQFLSAGVAVLCEKPLALDVAGARQVAACAKAGGALLTMASKFRFTRDVQRARGLLLAGEIGSAVRLENAFTARVDMSDRWNSDPARSGGGVLMDNGTHSVDIIRYLLGPVTEVLAVEGPRVQQLAVEDTVVLLARTVSGALASVELSWATDRMTDRFLAVVGTAGTVEVGWRGSSFRTVSSPAPVGIGGGYDKLEALSDNLANVARALRGQEELLVSAEDALASVEVVEAAYTSLRTGRWVPVGGR